MADLVRTLLARPGEPTLVNYTSTPWTSISFEGHRHSLCIDARDPEAFLANIDALDRLSNGDLIADLTVAALPGQPIHLNVLTLAS